MALLQEQNKRVRLTDKLVAKQRVKGLYPYVCPNPDYKRGTGSPKTITIWCTIEDTEEIADVRMFCPGDIVLYTGSLIRSSMSDHPIYKPFHVYKINYVHTRQENSVSLHRAGNLATLRYCSFRIDSSQLRHVDPEVFHNRKQKLWEIKFENVLRQSLKDTYGFERIDTFPIVDVKRIYIMQRLMSDPTLMKQHSIRISMLQDDECLEELFKLLWSTDTLRLVDEARDMAAA